MKANGTQKKKRRILVRKANNEQFYVNFRLLLSFVEWTIEHALFHQKYGVDVTNIDAILNTGFTLEYCIHQELGWSLGMYAFTKLLITTINIVQKFHLLQIPRIET